MSGYGYAGKFNRPDPDEAETTTDDEQLQVDDDLTPVIVSPNGEVQTLREWVDGDAPEVEQ